MSFQFYIPFLLVGGLLLAALLVGMVHKKFQMCTNIFRVCLPRKTGLEWDSPRKINYKYIVCDALPIVSSFVPSSDSPVRIKMTQIRVAVDSVQHMVSIVLFPPECSVWRFLT